MVDISLPLGAMITTQPVQKLIEDQPDTIVHTEMDITSEKVYESAKTN